MQRQAMSPLMPSKLKILEISLTIIGATTVVEMPPENASGIALVRTACLYSRRDSFTASLTFRSTRTPCAWENMALTWSLLRLSYVTPTRSLMDSSSSVEHQDIVLECGKAAWYPPLEVKTGPAMYGYPCEVFLNAASIFFSKV